MITTVHEGGGTFMLACPECHEELVHPTGLLCNPAGNSGKQVIIDADGISELPANAENIDGVQITLQFECENGHIFKHSFKFHEGRTFVETEAMELVQTRLGCRTIWRE